MAAYSGAKRKQEEKNLKSLRELAALLPNKHCFDCGQRGPTYVNMTIGSFCCTACSGILRGLNPPHRVKSISMATFSSEEVEFIRNRGNDECRKVWLGLHDGEVRFVDAMRDDQQIKDHLIKKYERKQWYVSPAEIAHQMKLMAQHSKDSSGASSTTSGVSSQPSSQRSPSQQFPSPNLIDASPTQPTVQSSAKSSYSMDLLSSDPFASPLKNGSAPSSSTAAQSQPSHPQPQSQGFANFANFDANFAAAPSIRPVDSSSLMPKSATVPAALAPQAAPLRPAQANFDSQQQQRVAPPSQPSHISSDGDKYSALAALDEIFHSSQSNGSSGVAGVPPLGSSPSMGWSHNSFGNTTNTPPGYQSSTLFGFPQQNAFPSASGVPKSQSTVGSFAGHASFGGGTPQNNQFAPASNPFFSGAAAPSVGRPAQQQANPFFGGQSPAANPFAPQPTMNGAAWGQPPVVNPLMGQQATTMTGVPSQANANWNPFWG